MHPRLRETRQDASITQPRFACLCISLGEPVRLRVDDDAGVGRVRGDEVDGADPPAATLEVRDHRRAQGAATAVDHRLLRHGGAAGGVRTWNMDSRNLRPVL